MELKSVNDTLTFMPLSGNTDKQIPMEKNTGTFEVNKSGTEKDIDIEKMKLRKAARGFEAIFIKKLMSSMRSTMSGGDMFGKGVAGSIYGDIIDTAVAEELSEKGILGLADNMYRIMVKSIEARALRETE